MVTIREFFLRDSSVVFIEELRHFYINEHLTNDSPGLCDVLQGPKILVVETCLQQASIPFYNTSD